MAELADAHDSKSCGALNLVWVRLPPSAPSMKYQAVGFDYSGVVFGTPSTTFDSLVSNCLGVSVTEFKRSYFKFNHLFNNNLLTKQELWRKVLTELGVEDRYEDLLKLLGNLPKEKINRPLLKLIDKLRKKGYKTGLLSNNNLEAASNIKKIGVARHFDSVVVSAEIGFSKPHPRAFEIFAAKLDIPMTKLIFIDDTKNSLSTAAQIGFTPVLYKDYSTLERELTNLGILE